jgi:hypothetical protein
MKREAGWEGEDYTAPEIERAAATFGDLPLPSGMGQRILHDEDPRLNAELEEHLMEQTSARRWFRVTRLLGGYE